PRPLVRIALTLFDLSLINAEIGELSERFHDPLERQRDEWIVGGTGEDPARAFQDRPLIVGVTSFTGVLIGFSRLRFLALRRQIHGLDPAIQWAGEVPQDGIEQFLHTLVAE